MAHPKPTHSGNYWGIPVLSYHDEEGIVEIWPKYRWTEPLLIAVTVIDYFITLGLSSFGIILKPDLGMTIREIKDDTKN